MFTERFGDMWNAYAKSNLFLFTGNARIYDGRLVMGRGMAQAVRDRWPGIDRAIGAQILSTCGDQGTYGLLVSPRWPAARVGAFQVKWYFRDRASLDLIAESARLLKDWCVAHPSARVDLNYPGIGNGDLAIEDVRPILEAANLPPQVNIWQFVRRAQALRVHQNPPTVVYRLPKAMREPLYA